PWGLGVGTPADPRLRQLLAGVAGVAPEDAAIRADVQMRAVDDRGLHVRPAAHFAPGDRGVLAFVVFERDIAIGAGLEGEDRLDRPVAADDEHLAPARHRRGDRALRFLGEPPEFLAGERIVAASVL